MDGRKNKGRALIRTNFMGLTNIYLEEMTILFEYHAPSDLQTLIGNKNILDIIMYLPFEGSKVPLFLLFVYLCRCLLVCWILVLFVLASFVLWLKVYFHLLLLLICFGCSDCASDGCYGTRLFVVCEVIMLNINNHNPLVIFFA